MVMQNIQTFWQLVEADDIREGSAAYKNYHSLLQSIAAKYGVPFDRTVACFAALSPQNDYVGNVRSLISVIEGWRAGKLPAEITVSTFGHCRDRAFTYLDGVSFVNTVKGPKIRAFYFNIVDPTDCHHITIDGHMVAIYKANRGTMKDNIIRPSEYLTIANCYREFALMQDLIPNQLQAILWFARKRLLDIRYSAQYDLFHTGELWRTVRPLDEFRAYR